MDCLFIEYTRYWTCKHEEQGQLIPPWAPFPLGSSTGAPGGTRAAGSCRGHASGGANSGRRRHHASVRRGSGVQTDLTAAGLAAIAGNVQAFGADLRTLVGHQVGQETTGAAGHGPAKRAVAGIEE